MIFEGDIQSAFDSASPKHVSVAMLAMGVLPLVMAAILQAQRGMVIRHQLSNLEIENAVKMNGCITPGGGAQDVLLECSDWLCPRIVAAHVASGKHWFENEQ